LGGFDIDHVLITKGRLFRAWKAPPKRNKKAGNLKVKAKPQKEGLKRISLKKIKETVWKRTKKSVKEKALR
jgi:hypothetical protein